MKKIFKSIALTLISLVIIITMFPVAVIASENAFEPRLTSPDKSISYYNKSLNVYSKTGYGMPNCTAYAFGRIYEITGEEPLIKRGNAGSWWSINKTNGYYEYGQEPKLGAIACWSNHVAVVEAIDGNTVTCSQSHWRSTYFDTCTFQSGSNRFGQKFYGYIYASDSFFEELQEEEEASTTYKKEKPQYKTANDNSAVQLSNMDLAYDNSTDLLLNSIVLQNAIEKQ